MRSPELEWLQRQLSAALGAEQVQSGPPAAAFAIDGVVPRLVVRPGSQGEVQEVVLACSAAGATVACWGGGAAMGLGNPPSRLDVVLRLDGLTRVVELDEANLNVTVEAGVRLGDLQPSAHGATRVPPPRPAAGRAHDDRRPRRGERQRPGPAPLRAGARLGAGAPGGAAERRAHPLRREGHQERLRLRHEQAVHRQHGHARRRDRGDVQAPAGAGGAGHRRGSVHRGGPGRGGRLAHARVTPPAGGARGPRRPGAARPRVPARPVRAVGVRPRGVRRREPRDRRAAGP